MYWTELYVAIVVGTILSLIYTEITGVLPGGVNALFVDYVKKQISGGADRRRDAVWQVKLIKP